MSQFHLVVGTPAYGGNICTEYAQSVMALKDGMQAAGHKVKAIFLGNESLIQRERNTVASCTSSWQLNVCAGTPQGM